MKRSTGTKNSMAVRPTDDGLHLEGSILWLDSHLNGELSFLSSAAQILSSKVPQVIATEETIKILESNKKKPNALICQYNRPFSIGKLKMELLPSGSVLGGASLHIETEKGRILYAPHLQTQRVPTVRQMQLKKAQTLILGAYHPDPNQPLPNRKREKDRLLNTVKAALLEKTYPIIICQPVAIAQEITKLLTDEGLPVMVHPSIYKINGIYETYGSKLGEYTKYNPKHKAPKVLLYPLMTGRSPIVRTHIPDGPLLLVEDTMEPTMNVRRNSEITERFFISTNADGRELREVIAAVAPREVFIFGPYAKRYCDELKTTCSKVEPLFPNDQPTLF